MEKPSPRNNGRTTDGRFGKGNAGRPKGARHKTTIAIQSLLEGEAEALTRKAVEMALSGDSTALKLCLDRIAPAPKDRPVALNLPDATTATEAVDLSRAVLSHLAKGDITPGEAAPIMSIVDSFRRVLEAEDFDQRLRALENKAP